LHNPRILPRREMRGICKAALEEEVAGSQQVPAHKRADGVAGLLGDFELHRPARLLLDNDAARLHLAAGGDVLHLQSSQVAGAQLAVDREIEEGEIPDALLQFEPSADRPNLFHFERRFLAGQLSASNPTPFR